MQRLLSVLVLFSGAVYAIEPYTCRNGAFPGYEGIKPARIVAGEGEKVHAREDSVGCPEDDRCLRKGYLINGDKVLVTPAVDGWVCTYYFGKKSDYTGWIPESRIQMLPYSGHPEIKRWTGRWRPISIYRGNKAADFINITRTVRNRLQVDGYTYWDGGKNSYGETVIHYGGVSASGKPKGNNLTVKEGDEESACTVRLRLINNLLVVNDNSQCGGMNVRFQSIYQKTHR
ncbi:TPA: hypothetical protein I8Y21_006447 [Klebsiella oxytoca]|uniref:Uncharacterized protein n=1 Tax=Klebsiella oxytoca TaxID=571 RepID=A0AAN5LEX1_KLEOX|nr:hypothetical protein [Klebsiella oxytoca]HAT1685566.1 hypothetical protein [Klebsiella oxytoca]